MYAFRLLAELISAQRRLLVSDRFMSNVSISSLRIAGVRFFTTHLVMIIPTVKNDKGTYVHTVQTKFQALFGFTLPLFHGRGLFTCAHSVTRSSIFVDLF